MHHYLVLIGIVVRGMVPNAIPKINVERWQEQLCDGIFFHEIQLDRIGELLKLLERDAAISHTNSEAFFVNDCLCGHGNYYEAARGIETIDIQLAYRIERLV